MAAGRKDRRGPRLESRAVQPAPDRTLAFRMLTRLPRRLVLAADRAARRRPALGRALRPAGAWLARGSARVAGGPAAGTRLSLEHLRPAHSQARELARGSLEPSVQGILATLIEPGFTVYDIGANVGFFTVLAARLAGPSGSVYAIEPAPLCAAAVASNARLNGLANVTVLERAAGRAPGRERLFVVADQSWSHLESRGRHPQATGAVDVEVVAIDDLVAAGELPPPDLVKIDVEGSELDALAGMRRTISEHRPRIVCELHETAAEVAALCEELGMTGRSLDGPEPLAQAGSNAHVLLEPS